MTTAIAMTEAELTTAVLELLDVLGFRAMHTRPARTAHGWRTPLQGPTAVGFPDIVALKGTRLVVAELKVGRNQVTPAQQAWLDAFSAAGAEVFAWRDNDWLDGTVVAALKTPKRRAE
jgi:hypothetical protein